MEVPASIMLSMLQPPTTHSAHSKLTQNKTLSSTTRLGSPKTSKQTASSSYTHQWLHFLAYQDHSSRIMAERKKPDPIEAILEPGEESISTMGLWYQPDHQPLHAARTARDMNTIATRLYSQPDLSPVAARTSQGCKHYHYHPLSWFNSLLMIAPHGCGHC